MKFLQLFIRLPEPKNVVIDDTMISKYRATCNHGVDSYMDAHKRITKAISLGKKVYTYGDEIIVRYFDINYLLIDMGNRLVLKNIWRNKYQYKIIKVSKNKKEKWNCKYGLTSHYGLKTVDEDGCINE